MAYAGETGYDPQFAGYRVGHSLNDHVIAQLSADPSLVALDYGFGDAEYKRAICDQVWSERTVTLFSATSRGLARYALEGAFATMDRFGRRLIRGSRLLPLVKRTWRRSVLVRKDG